MTVCWNTKRWGSFAWCKIYVYFCKIVISYAESASMKWWPMFIHVHPEGILTFSVTYEIKIIWHVTETVRSFVTEIERLWGQWNVGYVSSMYHALNLFPGWSNIMIALFSKVFIIVIKSSIWQYLNVHFVLHIVSCSRIIKSNMSFTKIIHFSWINVCFRGVLASEHEQQLHSHKALCTFILWSIFSFWEKHLRTSPGITANLLCLNPSFSTIGKEKIYSTYQYIPSFLQSET